MKAAETTAAALSVFPFNTVVNVLYPFIQTTSYPTIQGAIKMLTKLIEIHPEEVTDEHLSNILKGLIAVSLFIVIINLCIYVIINLLMFRYICNY